MNLQSHRANLLLIVILSYFILMGLRAVNLSYGPTSERAKQFATTQTAIILATLREETNEMQQLATNIDKYTIADVKTKLDSLAFNLVRTEIQLSALHQEWQRLDLIAQAKSERYSHLKSDVERLEMARKEQLDFAAKVFAEATQEESRSSFYLGLAISFPLGVLSSIVATKIMGKKNP